MAWKFFALAHAVGNMTEQAYRRADALDKRRALMEAWAGLPCRRGIRQGRAAVAAARHAPHGVTTQRPGPENGRAPLPGTWRGITLSSVAKMRPP
jgi:hypothetical protein